MPFSRDVGSGYRRDVDNCLFKEHGISLSFNLFIIATTSMIFFFFNLNVRENVFCFLSMNVVHLTIYASSHLCLMLVTFQLAFLG